MKLDKDLFPANMNMVKLDGKKVLVRPSQVESTKGKEVIIGEERQSRMIGHKNLEIGRWKKNERSKPRSHPKVTFDIFRAKYKYGKDGFRGCKNWTTSFPASGQYFYDSKLIRQPIQDTATTKFRSLGSSSTIVLSSALLPGRATNV
jgi:hypothetical protein